jgi:hypothetical protein
MGLCLGTADCVLVTAASEKHAREGKGFTGGTDLIRKHKEVAAVELGLVVLVTCGVSTLSASVQCNVSSEWRSLRVKG